METKYHLGPIQTIGARCSGTGTILSTIVRTQYSKRTQSKLCRARALPIEVVLPIDCVRFEYCVQTSAQNSARA